jgi:flavin-dependent dehydrogenase
MSRLALSGADGARSRVAAALDLDENREWIVGLEEVLEHVPLQGATRFHCFLDPRLAPGYLAWAVHDGQQVHIGVGGYPARFDPVEALKEFRASLEGILDLSNASIVERRGGRIPVGGVLPRIANSRGLLLGDAAGAVSPLTAGGLDPCMRLSKYAAEVISDYLRTKSLRPSRNIPAICSAHDLSAPVGGSAGDSSIASLSKSRADADPRQDLLLTTFFRARIISRRRLELVTEPVV